MERSVTRHALAGVVIGFVLSASFFLFFGAFQLVGFFLWSIVGGGGGGVLGGYVVARFRGGESAGETTDIVSSRYELIGAIVGAIVVRLAIFLLFGSY